ncbi:hypothetical protein BGZ94_006729 [Podila epigama]|nr:hypothetical protein BGZ94_006729 [Podila epigama]
MSSEKHRVNLLGAGVSGLSTALALLETGRYSVKVVATHLPSDLHIDYTSPWAGAHWRSYADIADLEQQKLDAATFKRFAYLAEHEPKAGVLFLSGHDYWEKKPKDFIDPWFKDLLPNYRHIPLAELPSGIEFGITYTTVTVNAPKYLLYLQEKVLALGGTLERATVPSLKALAQIPHDTRTGVKPDILVNCSALGSRTLFGVHDLQMFPTRGQIVIARVPEEIWPKAKQFTCERYSAGGAMGSGTITYVIPRDNGEIVLGGTMEHWSTQESISQETSDAIVSRVKATRPDLFSKITVLRSCAGLRPNRRGGVRVTAAVEQLDWNEGWNPNVFVVAHNYGHGPFGYQASVGCAQQTLLNIEARLAELAQTRSSARTMSKL